MLKDSKPSCSGLFKSPIICFSSIRRSKEMTCGILGGASNGADDFPPLSVGKRRRKIHDNAWNRFWKRYLLFTRVWNRVGWGLGHHIMHFYLGLFYMISMHVRKTLFMDRIRIFSQFLWLISINGSVRVLLTLFFVRLAFIWVEQSIYFTFSVLFFICLIYFIYTNVWFCVMHFFLCPLSFFIHTLMFAMFFVQ